MTSASPSTQLVHPAVLHAMLQARADELAARKAEGQEARAQRGRGNPRRRLLPAGLLVGALTTALFAAAVAAVAVIDTKNCSIEVVDISGYAICTTDEGATAEYIGDANETFGSAGTGTFNSFVRVQGSPTEQGYNTDATGQGLEFETKAGIWTHSILVSDIPVVNIGGTDYWEIFADINDNDNTPLISLNDIEVWFTDDPELTDYPFAPADAELIYDFDGSIKINDVNQGSGRGDLRYRIPLTEITIPTGCNYGNATCTTYFVLYNQWGTDGGNYASDSGFEEWKVKQYPTLQIVKNTIGGNGTFTYTVTGPSVPLSPAPSITTAGGTGSTVTYIVDPGTYTIDEDGPPAGWTLTGATCSINGGTATAYTEGSNLVLGETTHVVCTFTNTLAGKILVDKVTTPAGSAQLFEFDSDYGANFFLDDNDPVNDSGFLNPGTYAVAEVNIPAGWDLTSATCSDGSPVTAIVLGAGETVTCTFANTQLVQEGCTPGFWKTHTDLWDAGSPDLSPNYDPGDDFYAAFGITVADGGPLPDTLTLEGALNLGGGGIFALARHAAAALINSDSSIDYPYTTAQVIDIFRDGINASTAIPPDNYTLAQALAALSTANELGCPF